MSSKEDIDKELVANFTMTRLDEQVINRIVMQNRPLAVRMFNAIKTAYNKVKNAITGTEQDLSDIEKALDIFDRALAERRETVDNENLTPYVDEEGNVKFGDGEGGIKYYLGDFKHQVDAVLDKDAPEKLKSGLSVYVGKTPNLLRKAGLDDLPMLMNQGHLRDINHEKDPNNIHYHGLDIEIIKQLPAQIKAPVMIYDSISPHKKENAVCVVTALTDKDGYPVIVSIRANSDEGGNRYIDVSLEERKADKTNFVTSMYGKDDFWSHIEEVVNNDAMIYMNKNKTQRLASDNELYLLTRLDKLGFDKIIHQSRNIVNTNNMQKSQNNSQESNGKQHLLGGETSVVANNKTLAEARRMNLKGKPQSEIFKKTGWYKGIDKKWKKEIDPNDAELFSVDNENVELYNDNHNIVSDKEKIKYGNQKETGTDLRGISAEINGIGDKGRRSESDRRNIPGIDTEIQSDKINKKSYGRWGDSSGSGENNLGPSAFRSADKNVAGGETTNGRRFQEAVKRGDTKTARKLLDEQAVKNGYSNEKVYHGTHAEEIFTAFKDGGANWVSTDYKYAEGYAEEYTGNNKALAKQLFTDEEGGIFDLYIKKGKVLDVGDINLELNSMDAFKQFAEKIGFSDKEVLDCWNAGREYKTDAIWALTITPEFAEIARQKGYDTLKATERNGVVTYGVLYPENLKSAKIETYDDKGKLIPLEERFNKSNNDIRYMLGEEVTPEYNSTAKSRTRLERYENEAIRNIAEAMSVSIGDAREIFKPIIKEISTEYMKTGKLSEETVDRLFEEAYKNGKIVNDEAYKEYADLRNYLRNTKIYIDKEDASDIPDFFKEIRRYMGRLSVSSTSGTSVDSIYQELNGMYPSLFPDTIYAPSERMQKIMEVSDDLRRTETSLDAYYNTDELKNDLRYEFEAAVYKFRDNLWEVKHFNDSLEKAEVKPGTEINADSMKSVYKELSIYQKEADKAMAKILLTKDEKAILDDMLKGKRNASPKYVPDGLNKGNIMKAYEAMAPVRAMQNIIEEHKKAVRENKNNTAMDMIELSDFWTDKKNGLMYMRETQERNIYDIVKDKKQAEKIIEKYFTPVHDHEAERTRFKHNYFERVRDMDIDLRVRRGNKNTESEAVQFIGEVEGDIADLEAKAKKRQLTKDENDRLINLKGSLVDFKNNNPNLDYSKINNCIKEFHKIYDELFEEMNTVRIRNGYAPVEYRKNYFPHFMETGTDDITGKIAKALGINIDVTELPTDLTGRTENFKPGITWVQHVKRRNTNETKYDAIEGFQKYIQGVSDVIFHTDDIQNLRALERALRYKYSEKGVKDRIDAIRDNPNITDDERETLLEEAGQRNITSLGNFVNNLTEYTNLLANKKSMHDRSPETMFGRKIYNLFNWANSRVASNMVVGNLSTAITNFIPLTQATAVVGDKNMMIGFNQTVKNFLYDDGLTERSSFLTNRFGQDKLISKSKVADKLVWLMEAVDELTSGTIWRARYNQNIKKGMSDTDAIKDADRYAAELIAYRSKGALPTVFSIKNPLAKTLTAFQVETNNQLSHLFKDIPKEAGEKLALVIFKYLLGAYLFNDVYEKVCGRRPALDPLSWTNEFVGDVSGKQMPNSLDILASVVKREKVDFSTAKLKNSQAITNFTKNVVEDIPFVGGLIGGGRVPISSAAPDLAQIAKLSDSEVDGKKKAEIIHKNTISGGLINILMPYAGSQLTKTMKGVRAYHKGGSFNLNNEGEEQLQYAIDKNIINAAKTVTLGKSATKGAREWVDGGFGNFTAEQTTIYKDIIKDGKVKNTDAYNAIDEARKVESVKDGDMSKTESQVRHDTLKNAKGLSATQKANIEISFFPKGEDGKEGKQEKAKGLIDSGIKPEKVVNLYYDYDVHDDVSKEAAYEKFFAMTDGRTKKAYEKWGYEPELSVIKREALANDNSLSPEEKQAVNKALFGETKTEYDFSSADNYYYSILTENQQEGYDTYIKNYGEKSMNTRTFYYVVKVMNSQKDGKGSKKVDKIARLRKIGVPLNQANRIYNVLK